MISPMPSLVNKEFLPLNSDKRHNIEQLTDRWGSDSAEWYQVEVCQRTDQLQPEKQAKN